MLNVVSKRFVKSTLKCGNKQYEEKILYYFVSTYLAQFCAMEKTNLFEKNKYTYTNKHIDIIRINKNAE